MQCIWNLKHYFFFRLFILRPLRTSKIKFLNYKTTWRLAGCLSPVRKVGDKHIMVRNIFQVPGHSNHLNGMTCSNIYLFMCFSALRMDGWIFFQQKSNIIQLCSTPYFVTGLHYKGETRHLLQTAPFKNFQYREQRVNSRKPGGGIFKRSPPVFTFNFYLIDSVGNVVECMFKINVCLL